MDNKKSLDSINTRLLMHHVRETITNSLIDLEFDTHNPTDDVKNKAASMVEEFMNNIKNRKAISNFKVDSNWNYHSWKKLYPKLFKRIVAFLTHHILGRFNLVHDTYNGKYKWYHFVLPYKIYKEVYIPDCKKIIDAYLDSIGFNESEKQWGGNLEDIPINWILDYLKENIHVSEIAKLIYPWYSLDVDLLVTPVKTIEYININFIIDKNGKVFK